ncbi:VOC family protein [Ilyobacter polytropus]|uniref:Glyoxalase/bleomycin resistance protein/dioxygenase n=1 Tax=Ilyobacter polytropus (strain ATCC 51220 / DSM 2926 / LMG 16218 / CuHBu1) TaxID=572544 RepID=E3H7Q8_ILYPC|nr:VOC family protein [Ilyobacter polytropus]ADO82640.1 Glyoxalase/bleomycin resistance protein/dioxygenase [Ilyobacter polytropus DSM 2926]
MKIKKLHHICIQTDCYEKSKKFYIEVLGFELVKETTGFHQRDYNTWMKLDDFMIELQTPKSGTKFSKWSSMNSGPVHLSFLVENVQKAYNKIKAQGHTDFKVKNGKEIYKVENGYLFKVKAPEGTEIEVRDDADIN